MRRSVSADFFKDIFTNQVREFDAKRPTWRGFNVFAIDGDNYQLPADGDALEYGYLGAAVKGERETYYPRMYVSTAYDVLSGTVVGFTQSNTNDEIDRAGQLVSSLPQGSLTLYDRLYFSKRLVAIHQAEGQYFVARLKVGEKSLTVVQEFAASAKRNQSVDIEGETVHLLRVKNPQTGQDLFFATNMPRSKFRNKEICELYTRRWDVETSFRDLSVTMRIENWHTKFINGILQEIYIGLWIFNQIKTWEFAQNPRSWHRKLEREYIRPCFKSLMDWFTRHFSMFRRFVKKAAFEEFRLIIIRTMEKRNRLSRSYPRASKQPAKKHSCQALVSRRA